MATNSFQKTLEDFQIKIMEHSVEEARIKKEKAMVELETAKLQQEYVKSLIVNNAPLNGGVLQ